MESIKIISTSKSSAITNDLVLRLTNTTRLIFRPLIIDNAKNQEGSVKKADLFLREKAARKMGRLQ